MTSANDLHLYERRDDYIPRVAAVHDLCGYGKCSLGVAIPVLSAAGCDVCPVPTGLFSSHTAFPGWYMHDTTNIMKDYTDAWKGIGVEIDAVYSGFLGAPEQVDRIRDLYETYPNALRVVDPVMADHGKVYPTYTPELCDAMAELAAGADILTPNLSSPQEAALDQLCFIMNREEAVRLIPYVNLFNYGETVIHADNATLTSYGLLHRADYEPMLSPIQQKQEKEMTMQ